MMNASCTGYDMIPYSFFCNMIVEDDLEASSLAHTVSSSSSYYEYIRNRWNAARKMQKKKERKERKKNQRKMFVQARRHKEEADEAAPMIKRKKKERSSREQSSLRGSPRSSLVITGSYVTTKHLDDSVVPTYTTIQVGEEGSSSLIVRASEPSFNATRLDYATIEDQNDETALHIHKHSYFIRSSGCEVVHKGGS